MEQKLSYLMLETGEVYPGMGYGASKNSIGELVFNTAITGYQEVITDPSYKGQIVIFTYPHIGNIGTCAYDNESSQTWLTAIITREIPTKPSNWRSKKSFKKYLIDNNLPALAEIDTRKLAKRIRDDGNLLGMVVTDRMDYEEALEQILAYKNNNLSKKSLFCSNERIKQIGNNKENNKSSTLHVLIIDFGCKYSIVNMLKRFDCKISILTSYCSLTAIKQLEVDAVILSNGPGNPQFYTSAINLIKAIIKEQIPILGICLGHQLLAIALGIKIEKLQFGHHGINHPVKDLATNQVFITSQNHNYVLNNTTLPCTISVTHISLFDHSIQGFRHNEQMIVAFQGHPEGGPGPIDIQKNIVAKFLDQIFKIRQINYSRGKQR